jgi:sec-independent protein translocase protein TatC
MRDREMPLEDHLQELRVRILISLAAVVVGFGIGYVTARPVLAWILLRVGLPHGVIVTGVTEAFFAVLKIAFVIGLVLASPVILYQAAAFVFPGLLPHERRAVSILVVPGLLLFLAGMAAGFFWIVPVVLRIMLSFTGPDVRPFFTLGKLLSFIFNLTLPFGVIAELPLVAGALARLGILSPAWFERQRRYAVLIAFVLAAALAPPDAVSMLLMALPIYLVYELAALVVRLAWREKAAFEGVTDIDGPPEG